MMHELLSKWREVQKYPDTKDSVEICKRLNFELELLEQLHSHGIDSIDGFDLVKLLKERRALAELMRAAANLPWPNH